MDTWHHLRNPEAFPFNNLEFNNKTIISHELNQFAWRKPILHGRKKTNFAWSCEINGAAVAATTSWTMSHKCTKILHEYAKFSNDHAKSTCKFSLTYRTNPSSSPFRTVIRIYNIWFLSFPLLFLPFLSFDSTLTTSN